jgi:hypothetical protein
LYTNDTEEVIIIDNGKFDMGFRDKLRKVTYRYEGDITIDINNKSLSFKYMTGTVNHGLDADYDPIIETMKNLPTITVTYDEVKEDNIIFDGTYNLCQTKWVTDQSPIYLFDIKEFYLDVSDQYLFTSGNVYLVPDKPFCVYQCPVIGSYDVDNIRNRIEQLSMVTDSTNNWQLCKDLYPIVVPLSSYEPALWKLYCNTVETVYVNSGMQAEHQRRMRKKFAMMSTCS